MFVAYHKTEGRYRDGKGGSTADLQKARTFARRHDAARHASYWGADGTTVEVELVVKAAALAVPDEVDIDVQLETEIEDDFPRFQYQPPVA